MYTFEQILGYETLEEKMEKSANKAESEMLERQRQSTHNIVDYWIDEMKFNYNKILEFIDCRYDDRQDLANEARIYLKQNKKRVNK